MTRKERLLFEAAKLILRDECPPDNKHYLCKKYIDDTEEPRCEECLMTYLYEIINGNV